MNAIETYKCECCGKGFAQFEQPVFFEDDIATHGGQCAKTHIELAALREVASGAEKLQAIAEHFTDKELRGAALTLWQSLAKLAAVKGGQK